MVGMPNNFGGALSLATSGFAYPQESDYLSTYGYLSFAVIADMFIPNLAYRAYQLLITQFRHPKGAEPKIIEGGGSD